MENDCWLIVWIFICGNVISPVLSAPRPKKPQDKSWDMLVFAQDWPHSTCNNWKDINSSNTCFSYPEKSWTIHGLWPSKFKGGGPTFCSNTRFHPQAIYGIKDKLDAAWSPVIKRKKRNNFWRHEWEKHGTCASSHAELTTQFDYFYKALEFYRLYNMTHILAKAGIFPSQYNDITKIWNGIRRVINVKPQIICYENKKQESVLTEIRLCLNKEFKLLNCDYWITKNHRNRGNNRRNELNDLTNCAVNHPVSYPSSQIPNPPTTPPKSTKNVNPLLELYLRSLSSNVNMN